MTAIRLDDMELERERQEAAAFLREFCRRCFTERDEEKTLAMLAENVISVGASIGAHETALGREKFAEHFRQAQGSMPGPRQHRVLRSVETPCGPHCWTSFSEVELQFFTDKGTEVLCDIHMTATLHTEQGLWQIDSLHTSLVSDRQSAAGPLSLHALSQSTTSFKRDAQHELQEIIGQLIPGGVLGGYFEEGFPLLLANEQFLKMAGYMDYKSFEQDIGGMVENIVHPQDQQAVTDKINVALSCGKQYEVEYRMRRQDGSYIWVHDIGRKTVGDDGRAAIISVLIDVSEQVDERKKLELETGIDVLTGVHNRKGAAQQIEETMEEDTEWLYCIIDLDNFKRVNDIYGHKQGDQILCYIAEQLKRCFGQNGTVYRMGGDEFALFLPQYYDLESMMVQIQQVMEEYAWFLWEECPNTNSTLSVGGVYGRGRQDMERLYEEADRNLYKIKKGGKGHLCLTELKQE